MAPKVEFVANENTDRDFPDAFEITGAEFKVNGEYVCGEPCGSGSAEHSLGDIHIYVDINGDDSRQTDPKEPIRVGSINDPFATIERAFEYVNAIVTIEGDIYIHLGNGTFYISDTIRINHPNKIIIVGSNIFTSSIYFGDSCDVKTRIFWYGPTSVSGGAGNTQEMVIPILGSISSWDYNFNRTRGTVGSNATQALLLCGMSSQAIGYLDIITFAIRSLQRVSSAYFDVGKQFGSCASDGTTLYYSGGYRYFIYDDMYTYTIELETIKNNWGVLDEARERHCSISSGEEGFFLGGITNTENPTNSMDKIVFSIISNISQYGFLSEAKSLSSSCSTHDVGFMFGGYTDSSLDYIEEISMKSASLSVLFGDLTDNSTRHGGGATNDNVYALNDRGYNTDYIYTIDYITMNIRSTASHWGDLLQATNYPEACSGN